MRKYYQWGISLMLVAILSGCSPAGGGDSLAGTVWKLTWLGEAQVLEGYVPSLQFEEGVASGTTGCNEVSSPYSVKGDTLKFESILVTERACMDQRAMGQEGDYLRLLRRVEHFRLPADGQLELLDANQEFLLTFASAK
jgi:heat shock protein HslJ